MLGQLTDKLGVADVQLDRGLVASVRHGEALQVHLSGTSPTIDVGPISLPPTSRINNLWRREVPGCYVVGASLDLQWHEAMPKQDGDFCQHMPIVCPDGRSPPQEVQPLSHCLGGVPLFCAVEPHKHCNVFIVLDAHDDIARPVVQAIDTVEDPQEAFAELTSPDNRYALFWQAVRATMPSVYYSRSSATVGSPRAACHTVTVDFLRAAQFGWRLRQVDSPVVVLGSEVPVRPSASVSVGVQTVPPQWPLAGEPLRSTSLPVLSTALSCSPFLALCPNGPIFSLRCERFDVTCYVPCLPGPSHLGC